MNGKTLVAVLATATTCGAMTAPAIGGGSAVTEAGFASYENDGIYNRFYGDVDIESGSQKCVADRKVDLYHKVVGDDVKVGRTRSDTFNFWSITAPPDLTPNGTYYVRALKSTLANGTVCLADKSNEIEFVD